MTKAITVKEDFFSKEMRLPSCIALVGLALVLTAGILYMHQGVNAIGAKECFYTGITALFVGFIIFRFRSKNQKTSVLIDQTEMKKISLHYEVQSSREGKINFTLRQDIVLPEASAIRDAALGLGQLDDKVVSIDQHYLSTKEKVALIVASLGLAIELVSVSLCGLNGLIGSVGKGGFYTGITTIACGIIGFKFLPRGKKRIEVIDNENLKKISHLYNIEVGTQIRFKPIFTTPT